MLALSGERFSVDFVLHVGLLVQTWVMKTIHNSGRQHCLTTFGICLVIIAFTVVGPGCGGGSDAPTSLNLEIRDWYDLNAVRDNLDGNHSLMNNLDFTTAGYEELASPTANEGKGWQPIGSTAENDAFVGSLDGQGYELCDLFINRPDESAVGLFGVVDAGGIIENIGIIDGDITGYEDVGRLVGYSRGTVRIAYTCGNVTGYLDVGSLVGLNDGTVSSSYSGGRITGRDGIGGLVGKNEGTVSNSYSISTVNGNDFLGNLVGANVGTVSNSCAGGTANGNDFVGGLAGRNEGVVSKCYSTASVIGDEHAGGLVGQNLYGVVGNSFWDTQTSGQSTSDGGTGKTTEEMMDIATFAAAGWNITGVADSDTRSASHTWNIVAEETYPFLSWQPA